MIRLVPDLADQTACGILMQLAKPKLFRAHVALDNGQQVLDTRRTGQLAFIADSEHPVVADLSRRIAAAMEAEVSRFEAFQVVCYGPGEEYQPHWDAFPEGTVWIARGGQRVASAVLGLAAPDAGGETVFPKWRQTVPVVPGQAVIFPNVKPGTLILDPDSLHGGAPVVRGEKWIATKWLRASPFR